MLGSRLSLVRAYLRDLLWLEDSHGFLDRIDASLNVADPHGTRRLLVLFDSCRHPEPEQGPQPEPEPEPREGVHNSGWVPSPGMSTLQNADEHYRLEDYARGILGRFGLDPRTLARDI